ncbi:MAG: PD40 domain-containing protein [Bacteroidaceae bacterium]|nr:PD40 domain-containing protein [Bacteroidaceae bacterium]
MIKRKIATIILLGIFGAVSAQQVDYSVVSVPEESGIEFVQMTTPNDYVCMPIVRRTIKGINWFSNRILDISIDGKNLAYLSLRNNTTNIFIKALDKQGSSIQRTNRTNVLDFSYSPDGKYICFSEKRGKTNQIFQTNASKGYVCRQITNGNQDYSPIYSSDMTQIFFARQEMKGVSIWSYTIGNNFLSNYTAGMNPYPLSENNTFICTRLTTDGRSEIWKINYETGVEECIVSDVERSFTSPTLSPDKQWILLVGSSKISAGNINYYNTDIYVARTDGSELSQITYHASDDLSPVWSKDGKYIYFISQRGNAEGVANVWRMNFIY